MFEDEMKMILRHYQTLLVHSEGSHWAMDEVEGSALSKAIPMLMATALLVRAVAVAVASAGRDAAANTVH